MKTSTFMQTLIALLALEWDLCSQDPVVFCYRIGVSLREPSSGDSARAKGNLAGADYVCPL